MKRIKRDPDVFGSLDLFLRLSRGAREELSGTTAPDEFGRRVREALQKVRQQPAVLHGRRTQEMFAFVAASLGRTVLIKEEDCGEVVASGEGLVVPDYRLVLGDKSQHLVEVKNCHRESPTTPIRLTPAYVRGLTEYGALMGVPVSIAVFWSRWCLWALVPVEALPPDGLSLLAALPRNNMVLLGDRQLGTTPPLIMRVVADPRGPNLPGRDGKHSFRIGSAEFLCGGTRVASTLERNLAYQFMLFGDWPETDSPVELDGDRLVHLDFIFAPKQRTPNQRFELLGSMSSIVSRKFQALTSTTADVTSISPAAEPASLGVMIPEDYVGEALPLWQFEVQPHGKGGV